MISIIKKDKKFLLNSHPKGHGEGTKTIRKGTASVRLYTKLSSNTTWSTKTAEMIMANTWHSQAKSQNEKIWRKPSGGSPFGYILHTFFSVKTLVAPTTIYKHYLSIYYIIICTYYFLVVYI